VRATGGWGRSAPSELEVQCEQRGGKAGAVLAERRVFPFPPMTACGRSIPGAKHSCRACARCSISGAMVSAMPARRTSCRRGALAVVAPDDGPAARPHPRQGSDARPLRSAPSGRQPQSSIRNARGSRSAGKPYRHITGAGLDQPPSCGWLPSRSSTGPGGVDEGWLRPFCLANQLHQLLRAALDVGPPLLRRAGCRLPTQTRLWAAAAILLDGTSSRAQRPA